MLRRPRRSSVPSLLRAIVTVTPSSSEWPSCQAGTRNGPTGCSIPCCTDWSGKDLSPRHTRISEFGLTPNRVAALGENVILIVNLAWTAWLYASFLSRRGSFAMVERWQIAYLPAYSMWAALVVIVFPPVFDYR